MNRVICSLPFNSISIAADGMLRPCCNSDQGSFDANINNISLDNIINNSSIQNLRTSMLSGVQDPICSRCWKMEDIGNQSFRQMSNSDNDYGLSSISDDGMTPNINFSNLRYIDITLGNKCNLACRMCHPGSSSLVAKQYIKLNKFVKTPNIEFNTDSKEKILELIKQSSNLTSIYFLGGEPLINDFHNDIIDLLIELGISKNITLHYSTNLHTDIEKHLERWDYFKLIKLSISVDGSEEVYEYIRWPGSWNKIYSNLIKVCKIAKQKNKIIPNIAVTVQNLNVGNIHKLIKKIIQIDNTLTFYFIPVTGCNYLQLTPTHILESEIVELKLLENISPRITELINYYRSAINTSSLSTDKIEFFKMQKDFDQLRNQNLFKVLPHFIKYADEAGIETW